MGATRARAVTIGDVESYRQARSDELSVMRAFNNHASHCDDCADPLYAYQHQRGLCKKGYGYVKDIGDYLYCSNGRPYSLIDKQHFSSRSQVEIPADYTSVRQLFRALGEGFTGQPTRRPTTVINHKSSTRQERPSPAYVTITPNYSNSNRRRQRERYYEEKRSRPEDRVPRSELKRGSLYQKDEERRRSHNYDDEHIVFVAREPRQYRR